ncbi:GNAT family N-acetyltransferase [Chitinophaga rhizosphaerae]|uniref:GNAT family N-acetyltransferase n=1 Tax=Chitinophaga rhizosphaerae TaxID=1864947 RepID=UPI000F8067BE|nr:GNAT family N-acetyltransferase [Chitinophaga rhizosphaerae]
MNYDPVLIRPLAHDDLTLSALSELLIETVANGGSVSFMHPLSGENARAFWQGSLAAAEQGGRIILGAFTESGDLAGTVTLLLDLPPNQPHRAEIAKMMTAVAHRGKGIASALLAEAESLARLHGRSLITLDTAEDEGAAGFYEKQGYNRTGVIPGFALKPLGGLTGTIIYWKQLCTTKT